MHAHLVVTACPEAPPAARRRARAAWAGMGLMGVRAAFVALFMLSPEAYASIVVSDERPVAPADAIPATDAWFASIAFGAGEYVTAWLEGLGGTWLARISSSGVVLDEVPVALPGVGPDQADIALASDGGQFLAVWLEGDPELDSMKGRLFAARFATDGSWLDREPIALSATAFTYVPMVAWNGANFVIAWVDARGVALAARISPGGVLLDPGGVQVSPDGSWPFIVGLSCVTNCLVSWGGPAGLGASLLKPDATVSPGPMVMTKGPPLVGSHAGAGEHLLTWTEETDRESSTGPLRAARVADDGVHEKDELVPDPSALHIAHPPAEPRQRPGDEPAGVVGVEC